MFTEIRDRVLEDGAFYGVAWIDGNGLLCEIDDCEEDAIVEIHMKNVVERASCYMHMGFAIEDAWSDASIHKNAARLKTIEDAKALVPEHLKNGGKFEYD